MPPPTEFLVDIFHHRWAVRVVAELRKDVGAGRFASLGRRLGVGRATLKQTLDALITLGLVHPNPGYGHPLRPEYVLTARGEAVGSWAIRFVRSVHRRGIGDLALRKWSMPVLRAVAEGWSRFSELESALPGITARALALALAHLGEAGLVTRTVIDDHPPWARYRIAAGARRLADLVGELPAR